ncbi:hypothetical protein Pint_11573 [Pistacia integerrima]|uniref:Uncharacterized protein n=1 Tax=Pistacia integerrima TaxID=434235 RepID=A0ACC0XIS2_9ROSI|nr:hypothetical protein Pint_11573 [Pistacia integerrima]
MSSNKLSGLIPERLNGLKKLKTQPWDGNLLGYVILSMYTGVELDMVSKGLFQNVWTSQWHRFLYQLIYGKRSIRNRPSKGTLYDQSLTQSALW